MRALLGVAVAVGFSGCPFDGLQPATDAPGPTDDAGVDAGVDAFMIDGRPDGIPADANPEDADGDTIPDASDNCPNTYNIEQWDEDGDLAGDVCDSCPMLVAPQADGDGDGIGNGCDPRPGDAGDTLLMFEGFNVSGALPAGWSVTGPGTFAVDGGRAEATSDNTPSAALWTLPTLGDHAIDAIARVLVDGATGTTSASVLVDADNAAGLRGWGCLMDYDNQGRELWQFDPVSPAQIGGGGGTVALDTPYRVVGRSTGGAPDCNIAGTTMSSSTSLPGTAVAIRVRNGTSTFAYVAVYHSP